METLAQNLLHDRLGRLAGLLDTVYVEYTDDSGVMTLKLDNGRTQSVKGYLRELPEGNFVLFMSKVCFVEEYPDINYMRLVELNHRLDRCKVALDQGYLEVEACLHLLDSPDDELRRIAQAVAQAADDLEDEITGEDFY